MKANYYRILGVGPSADEKEIKSAYRKLAMQYHPDSRLPTENGSNESADASFLLVTEAYKCLSNITTRKQFDIELEIYLSARSACICGHCGSINRIREIPPDKEAVCGTCRLIIPLSVEERQRINSNRSSKRKAQNKTAKRVMSTLAVEAKSIAGEMAMAGLRAVARRLGRE